ncbi:MAG: hypothetical protein ACOYIE_08360, partial [Agathobaculum sp.]|uniref:hypothetical protein n=1 Tax=Agathobaculum sp. TaxID=2048138 RepID=UPI003D946DE8
MKPDDKPSVKRDVIVTGGTFSSDVSAYVAPNYECVGPDEQGNYTVQKMDSKLVVDKGAVQDSTQSATLEGDFKPNASIEGDKEGSEVKGYDVSLDLSNEGGNTADTVNLTVTKETAQSLANASSLSVTTDAGTVKLDAAALDKVGTTTNGDVVIKVQKNTVAGDDNVKASYTVSVQAGAKNLLPYGESNGTVTITVPKGDATVAWYVTNENGSKVYVEKLTTKDVGEDQLAITIGHLSTIELLATNPENTAVATVTVDGETTGYTDLNTALAAASANSTIKLLKDVEISDKIVIDKNNVIFDGGNHTIKLVTDATGTDGKPPVNSIFEVIGDNVTIQNAKLVDENHKAKHGVQFYESTDSKLSNVDITGTAWTGVLVNGSTVT